MTERAEETRRLRIRIDDGCQVWTLIDAPVSEDLADDERASILASALGHILEAVEKEAEDSGLKLVDEHEFQVCLAPAPATGEDPARIAELIGWNPTCRPGEENAAIVRQILSVAGATPAPVRPATGEDVKYRVRRTLIGQFEWFRRVPQDQREAAIESLAEAGVLAGSELCEHGILRPMMTCPACEPEKQAEAEAAAARVHAAVAPAPADRAREQRQ